VTEVKNCTLKPYFHMFVAHFPYSDLSNYRSSMHLQESFFKHQHISREINANTNSSVLISYLKANSAASTIWKVRRQSEKCVDKGSKYAHWIELYPSLHLSWVLGPFVYGRLQNPQTNEVTFAHVITPLSPIIPPQCFIMSWLPNCYVL